MSIESQPQIILATSSSQLLLDFQKAKIPHSSINIHHTLQIDPRKDPVQLAKEASLELAKAQNNTKQTVLIAAYTIASLDVKILEIPKNHQEADAQLRQVSGKIIHYTTGIAIIDNPKSRVINQTQTYKVTIAGLSNQEIKWYTDTKEWLTNTPINLQGQGVRLIRSTEGNPSPIRLIVEQLVNLGYEDFLMPPPPQPEKESQNTGSHLPFL
jgi:predicted house-cleaning NTP pyrophosphatase (Maf/HAM1 superfamily)